MSLDTSTCQVSKISDLAILISYCKKKKGLVTISGVDEFDRWELYDVLGDLVLSGTGSRILMGKLKRGMYMLEVKGQLHRLIH